MPSRLKASKASLRSKAEFTDTVNTIAALQLEIEEAEATLNKELAQLQEAAKENIAALKTDRDAKLAAATAYAEEHRDALFPGVEKTAASALASYGFRLSPPSLKALSGAWPTARTIEALQAADKTEYLTIKTALNKEALKTDLTDAQLAEYGLRRVQADEFWISPIRAAEPAEARLTA